MSSGGQIFHVPLQAAGVTLGVLSLRPSDPSDENWLLPEQMRLQLLESLTKQVALALEVERLQQMKQILITKFIDKTEK